jgi:hypothetical protein
MVVNAEMYNEAARNVGALREYSLHSGHLTRGFKAGKVMQGGLFYVGGCLGAASAMIP